MLKEVFFSLSVNLCKYVTNMDVLMQGLSTTQ